MHWQEVARRQAGVIGRRQLRASGLSADAVDGLVRRRELSELLPRVYSPRPVPSSLAQREWAAVLWSGGALSHRSAARHWQLPTTVSTVSHITVADRRFRERHPTVVLHRVPLPVEQCSTADGLLVTSRVRTMIDLLRIEPPAAAQTLLDRGLQQGWLTERDLVSAITEGRGRTGNRQLRALLDGLEPTAEAHSERILHRLLKRAQLRGWVAQYPVRLPRGLIYLDVAFPAEMLAIEVDGKLWHDERSTRFESDRYRQNELILAGWRVLRFTWVMLRDRPDDVLARIQQALAA